MQGDKSSLESHAVAFRADVMECQSRFERQSATYNHRTRLECQKRNALQDCVSQQEKDCAEGSRQEVNFLLNQASAMTAFDRLSICYALSQIVFGL